jgi:hypothetical protein
MQENPMKRWHEEFPRTHREWRKHYVDHVELNIDCALNGVGADPYEIDCVCDKQIGRFRKTNAWDCGNTQCRLCHSDKYPKRYQTYQEWCADLKLKEALEELD